MEFLPPEFSTHNFAVEMLLIREEVAESNVYLASFNKVSRGLLGAYEAWLRDFCDHHYDRAGQEKLTCFSRTASDSVHAQTLDCTDSSGGLRL